MMTRSPTSIEPVDALVVVDLQNAFVRGREAVPDHDRLVSAIDRLLARARSSRAPVIFLQNDGPAGAVDEPFQPGWELFLRPEPDDMIVRKAKDDGFDGTDLHAILTRSGVRALALCGVLSDMCLAATARAAMAHGYRVVLAHDSHATYDVPPGPGSEGVPAAMAARAAEWSLGDEVRICASVDEVEFRASSNASPEGRSEGL